MPAKREHTTVERNLVIFMAVNALVQFLADIVLEALHLIPTRINHLSLTLLNAFISMKTLSAISKNKFKFLHEDCQVLWLMEICLVAGDVYSALTDQYGELVFIYIRVLFVALSTFNFLTVSAIMYKYHLWDLSYQGDLEVRTLSFRAISRRAISFRDHLRSSMSFRGSVDNFDQLPTQAPAGSNPPDKRRRSLPSNLELEVGDKQNRDLEGARKMSLSDSFFHDKKHVENLHAELPMITEESERDMSVRPPAPPAVEVDVNEKDSDDAAD